MVCERSRVSICTYSSPVTYGGSVWVRAQAASSKETISSVPAWFRPDSETNLIKQGKIVTGRPCDSVAQRPECSHGMREVFGSSPGRAMCFFPPLWHLVAQCGSVLELRAAKELSRRSCHGSEQIRGRIYLSKGGSVAQWSDCLHGMREVLGSSPGLAMCFFLPCEWTK